MAFAALLSLAGQARADIFDDFETICIATDARTDRVKEEAFRMGWKLEPPRPVKTAPGPNDVNVSLVAPSGGDWRRIEASTFEPKVPQKVDSVFSTCMTGMRATAAEAEKRLAARFGHPGVLNHKGFYVWMYSRGPAGYVHETQLFNSGVEVIRETWSKRSVYTLIVIPDDDGRVSLLLTAARRPD